jgi:hypothetical protein
MLAKLEQARPLHCSHNLTENSVLPLVPRMRELDSGYGLKRVRRDTPGYQAVEAIAIL